MIDKQQRLQERIAPEIQEFRNSRLSLELATLDTDGMSHASYAPFVYQDLCYYILISDIAIHGQNLKHHSNVGIILLDDEVNTKNIFARRRLTYTAKAELISRDSTAWDAIITVMHTRLGDTITTLSNLQDFKLYRLHPITGRYVKGFGKAYELNADELPQITPLNEGHVKKLKTT